MPSTLTLFKEIVELANIPPLVGGNGDTIENDIALSDENNNLLLSVTLEQYTQILSALFNGAMTTYPEDYMNVIYPIIKAGKVEFCAALLDCLLNDADVISAIESIINQYTNSDTIIDPALTKSGFDVVGNNGCDEDVVWGQVSKLVDFMHTVNTDFLENFALLDALSDKYEAVIDIIPVLGDAVEAVVNFATESSNSLKLSYEASYNDSLRDSMACDLFCIALENPSCQLTLQNVIDYIEERYDATRQIAFPLASLTIRQSTVTLTNVIGAVGGGVYSGDDLVYIMNLFQLTAVALGDAFFNIDSAANYYAEMLDSVPSVGWESECDPCGSEWSHTIILDEIASLPAYIDLEGFNYSSVTFPTPVFTVGLGVVGGRATPDGLLRGAQITIADGTSMDVTGIDVWTLSDASRDPYGTLVRTFIDASQKSQLLEYGDAEELYVSDADFAEDSTSTGITVYALNDVTGSPSTDGKIYLQRITIRGTGTKPAIFT